MSKLIPGVNDLATLFPEVAKEAVGWDPSTFRPGSSSQKMTWKCKLGYEFTSTIDKRTPGGGCPYYSGRSVLIGFNDLKTTHPKIASEVDGQYEIQTTGPHPGQEVLEIKRKLKKWLKKEIGLVPDKQENWFTSELEVHSLPELKKKNGIETLIF